MKLMNLNRTVPIIITIKDVRRNVDGQVDKKLRKYGSILVKPSTEN